ncbi:uncharacterized protein Z518_05166 [Rhinocladiella mackenziei CBS 650.93]|uniref:Rhinocladiella mackenziei CBS 650.93 unplaced genomic scaffold supercont1.4, whole genome shotgun sequence n=1 Tax=Rhinocladiella mackenziei CBS 650.93 TaxID=1442369 RepID=A0A0D2IEQ1_9EURO|nr:uncharacterized protein Z518_05166 [Rhinocladiella mackenziei CBS 650.93]KIX04299.1 hypothetical protein Z518_05166 [Rhinocladiella mackenziei CBS 650.93]
MPKTKSHPQRSSAKGSGVPTNELPKSTIESKSKSVDNLRNEIQTRFQISNPETLADKMKDRKTHLLPQHEKKEKAHNVVSGRGKKRDRSGKVLNHDEKNSIRRESLEGDEEEQYVFKREAQALGGTAEDLEFLADADSESELEGTTNKTPKDSHFSQTDFEGLDKGMTNILREIALARGELDEDLDISSPSNDDDDDENDSRLVPAQERTPLSQEKDQSLNKFQRGKKVRFICDPKPDWFNISEPAVDTETPPKNVVSKDSLDQIREYAKSLLDEENQRFKDSQQSSSAQSFYNTIIASGTLSDRISALTLAVQDSPLHNLRALETLIGLARKRSRSQAVDVLRALKDLFAQGSLLPESRKLYAFPAQPALPYLLGQMKTWKRGHKLPRGLEQSHLVCWAFESWLKEQYFEVLKILEVWCNDEIEFSKGRAVSYVFELLKERPEQESNLLRLLINKLGDPVNKIASQASYLLMQLLIRHPAMKMVVVSAIETDFIFRPGQSMHGQYYAVVTLNQTALSSKEEDVAAKLLDIYFGMFTGLLKATSMPSPKIVDGQKPPRRRRGKKKPQVVGRTQTEELREKLISAILTGVNRAYPYVGPSGSSFTDHLGTLFKVTHSSNFNTSIQAMSLIQQLSTTHKASNDRFYRVLYESMLDPRLIIASKQQMYLNLLHRALKADLNVKRVKAFVKRLVQILSLHEPPFICGACFLIQDLESSFPSLAGLIDQPEDHEDEEEVFRDVDEDADVTDPATIEKPAGNVYDGHKRAPEYANADNSCVWELLPFLAHFHPSASVSADHVLRQAKLPGKPDLSLHTLSHFLDRFVYRNPKSSSSGLRGSSIMQPMAASDTQNVLIGGTSGGQRRLPVNSEAFKSQKSEEVAAEDVFFHQYFSSLGNAAAKKTKVKQKRRGEDDESADDEDEVWKAMMDSAPDLEGEEESEDDLDLSELDSEDVDVEEGIFDDDDDDDEDNLMETDDEASDFAGFDRADEQASVKKGKNDTKKKTKTKNGMKLKNLPTFASVEDYTKMLENDENADV